MVERVRGPVRVRTVVPSFRPAEAVYVSGESAIATVYERGLSTTLQDGK